MLTFSQEEHLQQGIQAFAPLGDGRGLGQGLARHIQGIQQGYERADQSGIQAADFVIGFNAITALTYANGITQQHAPQAEPPAVLLQAFRQAQAGALLGIQAPTDTGAFNPAMQGGQVTLTDGETGAYRRHVEQVEHFADGETAIRQLEQVLQGNQQWLPTALALIGEGERNVAWVMTLQLPEYGADMGRVGVDCRQHHDHVARAQGRVGAEACQELVVENLHLALRAVRDVKAH
ncbi:hypothetical protein D3C80_1077330 [compost metagenome]